MVMVVVICWEVLVEETGMVELLKRFGERWIVMLRLLCRILRMLELVFRRNGRQTSAVTMMVLLILLLLM